VAFSPDGRSLVQAIDNVVSLWDVQTGRQLATFKGHRGDVNAVAFAPDGKTVASASDDNTALIWDVAKVKRPSPPARALQAGDLAKLWQTLAEKDAVKAFDAIGELASAPTDAVAWIKERVKPARPEDVRGKVTGLSLEGEPLRLYRAVEVLERIGTPQARQLLRTLAAGAPGALLTTSAQAALQRH
jgi:hypothetical protein